MTSTRTLSRSFAGGEISPEMAGRIDITSYQTGLALCRNFIPLPQGAVQNRPGTEYVNEVKFTAKRTRLIPFSFSPTQTMVLEFGDGYLRFHTMGGTVLLSGNPYEISTPYLEADLFDLHYVQSADVLTIVHPNYDPRELRRLGATNWTLTTISFAPTLPGAGGLVSAVAQDPNFPDRLVAPLFLNITGFSIGPDDVAYRVTAIGNDPREESAGTLVTATGVDDSQLIGLEWGASGGAIGYRLYRSNNGTIFGTFQLIAETTATTYNDKQTAANVHITPGGPASTTPNAEIHYYVVTLVNSSGEESVQSNEVNALNDLTLLGAYNLISETSPADHAFFNVYKKRSGLYGYIGTSPVGIGFADDNIEPDMSRTPPIQATPFATANNKPGAVTYFEQRRLFAGTGLNPQTLWGTRTGTESNLSSNIPVRDDDAINFRIAAREVNTIRHLVPLNDVIILTNSAEWRLSSTDGGGLTPANLSVRPQSYVGANNVQPMVTSSSVLYAQARGGHVREIVYTLGDSGATYSNTDLSIMATHLFNFKTVVDMAYAKAPQQILWLVSSDGKLLSLSYVPEQKVAGWAQHVTGLDSQTGFESCCVVAEGNEDMLYLIVRRKIGPNTRRYVERLHTREFTNLADAFFVDCGDTYSGAPATNITGLSHLEGMTVSILGDGAVMLPKVVTGSQITLEVPVSKAQIGLPITSEIRTLPMALDQLEAMAQGRVKNVNSVHLRLYQTSIIKAGPDSATLREYKQRMREPFDSPPQMIGATESQEVEIDITPTWAQGGQVSVVCTDPLPATIQSIVLDVAIGG